jgi:hypothetical protein
LTAPLDYLEETKPEWTTILEEAWKKTDSGFSLRLPCPRCGDVMDRTYESQYTMVEVKENPILVRCNCRGNHKRPTGVDYGCGCYAYIPPPTSESV